MRWIMGARDEVEVGPLPRTASASARVIKEAWTRYQVDGERNSVGVRLACDSAVLQ